MTPDEALAVSTLKHHLDVRAAGVLSLPHRDKNELRRQLRFEMAAYSKAQWSAGWVGGLEFTLWSWLNNYSRVDENNNRDPTYDPGYVHDATLSLRLWRIGQLALQVEGWIVWDETACTVPKSDDEYYLTRFVTLAEWLPIYAAWAEKRAREKREE